MIPRIWIIGLLLCLATNLAGQRDTHTRIFAPEYHSLKISPENEPLKPAVSTPGGHPIVVSIDEWAEEPSYLEARLIHLNADWQPSDLVESEFLKGFNYTKVEDWALSDNTFQHYVNYRIKVPDQELTPTASGNYLLEIYREDEPDSTIAQARFSLSEATVPLRAEMCVPTDRGAERWQQLRVEADLRRLNITDPFSELILTVEQNGSPITERAILHPSRVSGNVAVYEHEPQLIFEGGNEFRRFETVVADYTSRGIDSVRFENDRHQAYLHTDLPKDNEPYRFDKTQYGASVVRASNASDGDLGADYVTVHFSLDASPGRKIFIEGELTRALPGGMAQLEGDGLYHLSLPLKQGAYNYRYLELLPDGSLKNIDGSKHETRNRYTVKLFHRPPGSRGDRLVGTTEIIANE